MGNLPEIKSILSYIRLFTHKLHNMLYNGYAMERSGDYMSISRSSANIWPGKHTYFMALSDRIVRRGAERVGRIG